MDAKTSEGVINALLNEVERLKASPANQVTLPGKLGDPTMQLKVRKQFAQKKD